jgi:arylsulfatase A-like enzyme
MQAPKEALKFFANLEKSNPQRAIYAAMLYQLDIGIGQIREKLKQLNIADRTAIIYLSDQGWHQGGKEGSASNNGGLNGGKYYLTEGGLRVPCIMSLPGHVPGVCNTLAINLDLFPTILSLAGCPLPTQPALDGQNLIPYLNSQDQQPDRTLFWRFRDDQIKTGDQWAVRRGPWKALYLHDKIRLYKIDEDETEQNDLAIRYPEQLDGLRAAYEKWTNTLPAIQWQSKMESAKK